MVMASPYLTGRQVIAQGIELHQFVSEN